MTNWNRHEPACERRFSKHDQIGEVKIPLNTIDLAQTIEEWRPVTKVENDNDQVSWARGRSGNAPASAALQHQTETRVVILLPTLENVCCLSASRRKFSPLIPRLIEHSMGPGRSGLARQLPA